MDNGEFSFVWEIILMCKIVNDREILTDPVSSEINAK